MKKIGFLCVLLLLSKFVFAHDFYIGIATLHYNSKTNHFEVAIKLTAHDFEKAIYQRYKQQLKLASSKEHPQSDNWIKEYLQAQFKVTINNTPAKPIYIGKEVHLDDNLFIFLEFKCPDIIKTITIKNLLLLDCFPAQENITHLEKDNQRWSYTFTKLQQEKLFTFN